MRRESRLSLWTMEIAIKVQSACSNRANHLIGLMADLLRMMR